MRQQDMHHFMGLQRHALLREFVVFQALCVVQQTPALALELFALTWIERRAAEFRQWYQATHGQSGLEEFPLRPENFL